MTEKNILDTLPVLVTGDKCQKCGALKGDPDGFTAYNVDESGNVTDCNKCESRKQ